MFVRWSSHIHRQESNVEVVVVEDKEFQCLRNCCRMSGWRAVSGAQVVERETILRSTKQILRIRNCLQNGRVYVVRVMRVGFSQRPRTRSCLFYERIFRFHGRLVDKRPREASRELRLRLLRANSSIVQSFYGIDAVHSRVSFLRSK